MAVVFPESTIPFSYNAGNYDFETSSDTRMLQISEGDSYIVEWDGVQYTSVCGVGTFVAKTVKYIGNLAVVRMAPDTGEPFLFVEEQTETGYNYYMYTSETDDYHTISIYTVEEETDLNVIWAKETLDGFSLGVGLFSGVKFAIAIGEKCKVVWDGIEYECAAFEGTMDGVTYTCIGNLSIANVGDDTGEPFLMGVSVENDVTMVGTTDIQSTSHTVAIYAIEEEPEDTPTEETTGISIVLYDRTGEPVTYEGIETLTTDTPDAEKGATFTYGVAVEGAEYDLDMASGDQKVSLEKGSLLKGFTVKKPANLVPAYIKKNVEIGGVVGEFAGDEMEKTVELSMTDGDQVIEADADTVMTKVTVTKPETLVPENILDGVDIGGVVGTHKDDTVIENMEITLDMSDGDQTLSTDDGYVVKSATIKKPDTMIPENIKKDVDIGGVVGTFEAGGETLYYAADPEWIEKVVFWDYDGTAILMCSVEEANALTELPVPPAHEGLIFQGWNFTLEEIQNTTHALDIGAIYITDDGKTHVKINISNSSYKTIPVNFSQTVSAGVTIDWGDGTVGTISGTGVVATSHTYANTGEYEITFDVADGCDMVLGGGTAAKTFIMKNQSYYYNYVQELYIGSGVVGLSTYAFFSYQSMNVLTIPEGVTSIGNSGFYQLYILPALLLPRSVNTLGDNAIYYAGYNMGRMPVVSVPNSVTELGENCFAYSGFVRIITPDNITTLPNGVAYCCYTLRKFIMGNNIHTIDSNAFYNCSQLTEIELSESLTNISMNCFYRCGIEKLVIPEGVTSLPAQCINEANRLRELILPETLTSIGDRFGYNCQSLRRLIIPENVTSIGTYFCYGANSLETVIIKCAPTIGSTFLASSYNLKEVVLTSNEPLSTGVSELTLYGLLYVPDELTETYKTICTRTPTKNKIKPLSEYPGERFWE